MTIVSTLISAFRHDPIDDEYVHQYAIEVEGDEAVLPNGIDGLPSGFAIDFETTRVAITIAGSADQDPRFMSVSASGPATGNLRWHGTQNFKFTPSKNSLGAMPDWLRTIVADHVPARFLAHITETP